MQGVVTLNMNAIKEELKITIFNRLIFDLYWPSVPQLYNFLILSI